MSMRVHLFAATKIEFARIDPFAGPAGSDWPYVDCADWLDGLTPLVAALTGRDISEFGEAELVFPEVDDAEWEGPWMAQLPVADTEAMAFVDDATLRAYAEAERLGRAEIDRNTALRDLCNDALAEERDVYQWSSN